MKFVSEKTYHSEKFESSVPFDVEYVKKLELDCGNMFTFEYSLRDFVAQFPVAVTRAVFVIKVTRDSLFAWATVYIDGDNAEIRKFLDKYGSDYGDLSCNAELTDDETKKLLLHMLLHQIN